MTATKEQIYEWADDCYEAVKTGKHDFNRWEVNFLDEIIPLWYDEEYLTDKQIRKLANCWRKL